MYMSLNKFVKQINTYLENQTNGSVQQVNSLDDLDNLLIQKGWQARKPILDNFFFVENHIQTSGPDVPDIPKSEDPQVNAYVDKVLLAAGLWQQFRSNRQETKSNRQETKSSILDTDEYWSALRKNPVLDKINIYLVHAIEYNIKYNNQVPKDIMIICEDLDSEDQRNASLPIILQQISKIPWQKVRLRWYFFIKGLEIRPIRNIQVQEIKEEESCEIIEETPCEIIVNKKVKMTYDDPEEFQWVVRNFITYREIPDVLFIEYDGFPADMSDTGYRIGTSVRYNHGGSNAYTGFAPLYPFSLDISHI